jgi:predicted phage gp36 major capsid-like protein
VYPANVDTACLRWLMPSRTFIALRKHKDSNGLYIL